MRYQAQILFLLKKIIGIMALLGILLQTFSQVVIVAEYYARKDYIAKNLCENRNKPKMHCNGKCHLKKKLAKEGKEQAPSSRNQKNEDVVNLICETHSFAVPNHFVAATSTKYFNYNDLRTSSFHHAVFRPPIA